MLEQVTLAFAVVYWSEELHRYCLQNCRLANYSINIVAYHSGVKVATADSEVSIKYRVSLVCYVVDIDIMCRHSLGKRATLGTARRHCTWRIGVSPTTILSTNNDLLKPQVYCHQHSKIAQQVEYRLQELF